MDCICIYDIVKGLEFGEMLSIGGNIKKNYADVKVKHGISSGEKVIFFIQSIIGDRLDSMIHHAKDFKDRYL